MGPFRLAYFKAYGKQFMQISTTKKIKNYEGKLVTEK